MAFPTFADVLGQERALAALRGALESDRVHHAWLFAGPAGVGKHTTALAFAGLLLDPTAGRGLTGEWGVEEGSAARRLLEAGAHTDLHLVRKELGAVSRDEKVRAQRHSTIAVEVVREFLVEPSRLSTRSSVGARAGKVFIVDEADRLGSEAANAALKALEEPAPGVVMILVTEGEHALLPTIRSRCRRVVFSRLDEGSMGSWAARARVGESEEERAWLLRFADGSPGRAAAGARYGLFAYWKRVWPMLERSAGGLYGLELGEALSGFLKESSEARYEEMRSEHGDSASKETANAEARALVFAMLGMWARELVRREPAAGARAADLIARTEEMIDGNVNPLMAMERLSVELAG